MSRSPAVNLSSVWCRRGGVIAALAAAALLWCGGVLPSAGGQQTAAALPADLALVPSDAVGFVTVRVADLWNSDAARQVRQHLPREEGEALQEAEEKAGMSLRDVERVTVVLPEVTPQKPEPLAFVTTTKPFDRDKLLQTLLPQGQEKRLPEKTYYLDAGKDLAVYFAGDRIVVLGTAKTMAAFLEQSGQRNAEGPLNESLHRAAAKHLVTAGLNPASLVKLVGNNLPPQAEPFKPLLQLRSASLTLDSVEQTKLDLRLKFAKADVAKEAQQAVQGLLFLARAGLAAVTDSVAKDKDAPKPIVQVLRQADEALKNAEVKRQDTALQTTLVLKTDLATVSGAVLESVFRVRQAAGRMRSQNNLKQLALAMHNYHDTYGHFPPAALTGKDGKPLLSWRVALLPFLEQQHLYKQFHLDEPWDSEHNKKLLAQMPRVFALPDQKEADVTYYQVFVGPKAFFEGTKPMRFADITDGLSNTIMIVEAADAVPWTKPQDLPYAPDKPLPRIGGHSPDGTNAAFGDGAVRALRKDLKEETLRALITRNGGEVIKDF